MRHMINKENKWINVYKCFEWYLRVILTRTLISLVHCWTMYLFRKIIFGPIIWLNTVNRRYLLAVPTDMKISCRIVVILYFSTNVIIFLKKFRKLNISILLLHTLCLSFSRRAWTFTKIGLHPYSVATVD